MRIRAIKPEFYRSADIDALDWDTRFVFIGLWSYVDDNGVGIDKLSSIVAELYAEDMARYPRETLARVEAAINTLADRCIIERYNDTDSDTDRCYLFITGWDHHQKIDKPNRPRYPRPTPGNIDSPPESVSDSDTDSRESRESLAPGTEEQRNRGTEESTKDSSDSRTPSKPGRTESVSTNTDSSFDEFWKTYPRKESKPAAIKAWTKAIKRANPEVITQGAMAYRADPNRDQSFTKLPATWLNNDCWNDPLLPSRNGHKPPPAEGWYALAEAAEQTQQEITA